MQNDSINYSDQLGLRKINVEVDAFIPNNIKAVIPIRNNPMPGTGWFNDPNPFLSDMVGTDDRSEFGGTKKGSSRVSITASIDSDNLAHTYNFTVHPGTSHHLDVVGSGRGKPVGLAYVPGSLVAKQAAFKFDQFFVNVSGGKLETAFSMETAYPFSSIAPPITIQFSLGLCVSKDGGITMRARGVDNVFPAYEVVVDDKVIYGRKPDDYDSAHGPSPMNLGNGFIGFGGKKVIYDTGAIKL